MAANNIIRHSSKQAFMDCPMKYHLRYVKNIETPTTSKALQFGSAVHEALDCIYRNILTIQKHPTADVQLLEHDFAKDARHAIRNYAEKIEAEIMAEEENDPFVNTEQAIAQLDEQTNLAMGVVAHYCEQKLPQDIAQYEVLDIEGKLQAPILTPDGTRAKAYYSGTYDLIVREKRTGLVWLMEHKTTAMGVQDMLNEYLGQHQHVGYLWLVEYNMKRDPEYAAKIGKKPVGVIYNIIRKKVPSQPHTIQCKKCKGSGDIAGEPCETCNGTGIGGISKKACDTTPQVFADFIEKHEHLHDDEYGKERYQELVSANTMDRFFARGKTFVTEQTMANWMQDTYAIHRLIGKMLKGNSRFYRNYKNCSQFGSMCQMKQYCEDPDMTAGSK